MKKLKKALLLFIPVLLISLEFTKNETSPDVRQVSIPEPVVPVYTELKNLHLTTFLVKEGKPSITIIAPKDYNNEIKAIQDAIRKITGVRISAYDDSSPQADIPMKGNLILLGNRSSNKAINKLYDQGYTFLDLKYPGNGGFVMRSLHNPFGNGNNIIFAGGSDREGVRLASESLIRSIQSNLYNATESNFFVGYLCQIKLGKGYILPENIEGAQIWEASEMYGSSGYFGWNMVSKNMALYYMTDEEKYLKEFLRLAFPDITAIKEIEEYDGERIENKKDPLAGPYHYSAHMMILLWDLIEESPLLSDEERLNITNAFARQLPHRVVEGVYRRREPPASIGDRHNDWSAFSLYVLGRYFEKDYPDPVWEHCITAAKQYFSSLSNTYWMAGNNDHLFWFTSFYDPLINYLLMTEERDPVMMKNLRAALNTQEILSTGLADDWGVKASSLSMLNKAAYILNDGRWLYYRERINLNTEIFRLGQSYWPEPGFKAVIPLDQTDVWNIQQMSERMWETRKTGFLPEQSFRWGSYRTESGPEGDYILIKGYNGAGRNPYHTYSILELRLNGATLLKGYGNQVLTSANGMVEPLVPMDARLLYRNVTENFATAISEVPDLPFVKWKRTLCVRKKKFAIIADDLQFRTESDNLSAEINWEIPDAKWMPENNYIKIQPANESKSKIYELHPSDKFDVQEEKVISMKWCAPVKFGENRVFFHLLGERKTEDDNELQCLRLSENAAMLSLTESAIVVSGEYSDSKGELILLGETFLYGRGISSVGTGKKLMVSDSPAEVDWDFNTGNLTLINDNPINLLLAVNKQNLIINGKNTKCKMDNGFLKLKLDPGRHLISKAIPAASFCEDLQNHLNILRNQTGILQKDIKENKIVKDDIPLPALKPVLNCNLGGSPVESIVLPSPAGELLCVASGNIILIIDEKGEVLRQLQTNDNIRVLHWWAEPRLLLAGCIDEKVIAFNEAGQKAWEFTSLMDNAVYEAGKQYWFKSAHPGIYGIYSGYFDNRKSRAFIGSACTLEIIDEEGQLIKRLPVFWGPGRQFLIVDAEDESKNLLISRWHNDRENFAIINSKSMTETGRGYNAVPTGHSYVGGWDCMNRFDNFLIDLDGDNKREVVSAINGTWNRITIYSERGIPLYNAQFGPGLKEPRSNIHMMDVGDINGDGKQEIVTGLSSGFVNALDCHANLIWSVLFSSPPIVTKVVAGNYSPTWIFIGCKDGKVFALDKDGRKIMENKISGKPADLRILQTSKGPVAVATTENGEISGFRLN